jgi:penicillin-binding protein 1A
MGLGGRKTKGRCEPRFDAFPIPGFGLRLSARDRLADPAANESESRRTPAARKERRPASDDAPPRKRGREDRGPTRPANTRAGGGGRGAGKRRSFLGRMLYWGLVLGLWGTIATVGAFLWIAAHLPPIQSLEVPKRPPAVQILGLKGHTLATRGDMGGAAVARKPFSPSRTDASTTITASIRSGWRAPSSRTSCAGAYRKAGPP